MAHDPISDGELDDLFSCVQGAKRVVLAVSGGVDSVALLHLFARWQRSSKSKVPEARVATVDHGLRRASRDEAEFVAGVAAKRGLNHTVLRWTGPKPKSRVQEVAREARYRLLAEFARENDATAILTAHHQDDQAETVLMRLARGSGLDGLSGMTQQTEIHEIQLLRPLLGVPKARLLETLRASGQPWCEDPSNADTAYERVRIRKAVEELEALGLSAASVATSARRLNQARQALEAVVDRFVRSSCEISRYGCLRVPHAALAAEPREIATRFVQRAIRAAGDGRQVRLAKIDALVRSLQETVTTAATLGGCLVVPKKDNVHFYRELGREGLPECTLAPGETVLWDGRFELRAAGQLPGPVTIRALGSAGSGELADVHQVLPKRACSTVPLVWREGYPPQLPEFVAPCCNDTIVIPPDRLVSARYASAQFLFGLTGRNPHIRSTGCAND